MEVKKEKQDEEQNTDEESKYICTHVLPQTDCVLDSLCMAMLVQSKRSTVLFCLSDHLSVHLAQPQEAWSSP